MREFPLYRQLDQMDCGPTCLRMLMKYYGKNISIQKLRDYTEIGKDGVSLLSIADTAEQIGFRTDGVQLTLEQLREATLPVILHWDQRHFVILYKIKSKVYYIADPSKGRIKYSEQEFASNWFSSKHSGKSTGVALLVQPTSSFLAEEAGPVERASLRAFFVYLLQYKRLFIQLLLGLLAGTFLQTLLPFVTQSIVDTGINTHNLGFVTLMLIAQMMLIFGRTSVDFLRSWILLHISTRLNISILSDFLAKIMRLPISFFDTKLTGDLMQRMNDQKRIESFLTGQSLSVLFSMLNLLIFSVILATFNLKIFILFLVATLFYTGWILMFLSRRKQLDIKRFEVAAKNQSGLIQMIQGMQEIKLSGAERQKRWQWERLQAKLFHYSVSGLSLAQYQQAGATLINEIKNVVILYLVAQAVIDGQMTLGGMMAVQYILGQLSSPVEQLLHFIQGYQDATISMERLNELYEIPDESSIAAAGMRALPADRTINIKDLSFRYPGAGNEPVLKQVSMQIPHGKTTAIVGMSGSGKTTLLKLLLGFYRPQDGEIRIFTSSLDAFEPQFWRKQCGVVMQDGYIFSDTIMANIAVGEDRPDMKRLWEAIEGANIGEFIRQLPMGITTRIGQEGNGLSQGQRQRLLIARAIYKDPAFLFFDEATNALDSTNERVIIQHLNHFFVGRTVVIVAHRLSTVKDADQIIVLDRGHIAEVGTHQTLTERKGVYYDLVRNQLELEA